MEKPALILWGGTDISPRYYQQLPGKHTQHANHKRDAKEFNEASKAIHQGQAIVGICRGAQLLCVLNGGSLYQHSESSKQDHPIVCVDAIAPHKETTYYDVSASHHQIMRPEGNYQVLGWNPEETIVYDSNDICHIEMKSPEIIWWPETKCLGIQAHPEWANDKDPWLEYINQLMSDLDINCLFENREAYNWTY